MPVTSKVNRYLSIALASGLMWLSGCTSTTTQVMVRAWSADDYKRVLVDEHTPRPETYLFLQGQFESGSIRDDSLLSESDFVEVATQLKTALQAQNYVNANPGQKVDLIIAVHWGQTNIEQETVYIEMEDDEGFFEELEMEQITPESLRKNALVLGTADKIFGRKRGFDREDMIAQASDERYYFVLIAYDFDDILLKKRTVRWVTQFSVDASGTNYLDALPAMTRAASNYFGKNLQDIEFTRENLGNADVQFGEIEVVGVEK